MPQSGTVGSNTGRGNKPGGIKPTSGRSYLPRLTITRDIKISAIEMPNQHPAPSALIKEQSRRQSPGKHPYLVQGECVKRADLYYEAIILMHIEDKTLFEECDCVLVLRSRKK